MPPAPTTSAQALGSYQQFASSMQSPDQAYAGAEQSLGVPQAQQQVSGLRQAVTNTTNLLNNVAPSVMGRTANSLVTSAQANRQIGNEQAPIAANLRDQTGKEAQAEGDLSSLLGRAGTMASLKVQGDSNKLASLKSIYDSLYGQEQDRTKAAETAKEFSASQAMEQAKLNESVREAHVSEGQNQQKLDQSGAVETTQQDIAGVTSDLIKLQGGDGYVAPKTYSQAALSWANAGYSLKDFNKFFGKYKNPNNPYYTI